VQLISHRLALISSVDLPAPSFPRRAHQVRWRLLVLAASSAVFGSGSSARPDFLY
jgi:hypothetical protein